MKVDQDLCIGCGACVDLCPEVFDFNEDSKASAIEDEVPAEAEDLAREAMEGCPVSAISED